MKIISTPKASLVPLNRLMAANPLRCTIFEAYKRRISCRQVLKMLVETIKTDHFRPFFKREEIDRLFEEEVLKDYGNGRYFSHKRLDTFNSWNDLLNNIAAITVHNYNYFRQEKDASPQDRQEAFADFRGGLRQTKIIEDWIFYTPGAVQLIEDVTYEPPTTIGR